MHTLIKSQANFLSFVFGKPVKKAKALEVLSYCYGYPNWDTACKADELKTYHNKNQHNFKHLADYLNGLDAIEKSFVPAIVSLMKNKLAIDNVDYFRDEDFDQPNDLQAFRDRNKIIALRSYLISGTEDDVENICPKLIRSLAYESFEKSVMDFTAENYASLMALKQKFAHVTPDMNLSKYIDMITDTILIVDANEKRDDLLKDAVVNNCSLIFKDATVNNTDKRRSPMLDYAFVMNLDNGKVASIYNKFINAIQNNLQNTSPEKIISIFPWLTKLRKRPDAAIKLIGAGERMDLDSLDVNEMTKLVGEDAQAIIDIRDESNYMVEGAFLFTHARAVAIGLLLLDQVPTIKIVVEKLSDDNFIDMLYEYFPKNNDIAGKYYQHKERSWSSRKRLLSVSQGYLYIGDNRRVQTVLSAIRSAKTERSGWSSQTIKSDQNGN